MMAACDKIRYGAVEQLRTLVSRLQIPILRRIQAYVVEAIQEAYGNNSDITFVENVEQQREKKNRATL